MVTSSYKNFNSTHYKAVSISGDKGEMVGFQGASYPTLAPKKEFWKIWHDNIGKISDEENNKYYIREYYNQVLSQLDPDKVYSDLRDKILLCYEEPNEFCHRFIISEWIKLLFGEEVPEIKLENSSFKIVERDGFEWIGEYLEQIIREKTTNMRGFTSLMALRLFEKSEMYESEGYEFDKTYEEIDILLNGKSNILEDELYSLRQKAIDLEESAYYKHLEAAGLRVQADDAEQEYVNDKIIANRKLIKNN